MQEDVACGVSLNKDRCMRIADKVASKYDVQKN